MGYWSKICSMYGYGARSWSGLTCCILCSRDAEFLLCRPCQPKLFLWYEKGLFKNQSFSYSIGQFSSLFLYYKADKRHYWVQNMIFMGLRFYTGSIMSAGSIVFNRLPLIVNSAFSACDHSDLILFLLWVWEGRALFRSVQEKAGSKWTFTIMQENLIAIKHSAAAREIKRFIKANTRLMEKTVFGLSACGIRCLYWCFWWISVSFWFCGRGPTIITSRLAFEVGDVVAIINYITRITGTRFRCFRFWLWFSPGRRLPGW